MDTGTVLEGLPASGAVLGPRIVTDPSHQSHTVIIILTLYK